MVFLSLLDFSGVSPLDIVIVLNVRATSSLKRSRVFARLLLTYLNYPLKEIYIEMKKMEMKTKKGKDEKNHLKKKSVLPGLEVFSDLRGVGISIAPGMQNVRSGKVLY